MLISIVLLAFLSLGAVSAFDNSNDTIGNNIVTKYHVTDLHLNLKLSMYLLYYEW